MTRATPTGMRWALPFPAGGIRSATFNLGVLQALERRGILKYIDYLSTVSGAGYIGSSLTWFMSRLATGFPFGTTRADNAGFAGKVTAGLRAHGSYLTPGDGITWWALAATIIMGIIINLAVVIPPFFAAIRILQQPIPSWLPDITVPAALAIPRLPMEPTLFGWLFALAVFFFAAFVVVGVFFSLTTRIPCMHRYTTQRLTNRLEGRILTFAVLLLAVGTLPTVHNFMSLHLREWMRAAMSAITLSGAISAFSALKGRKSGNEAKGIRSFLLSLGLGLAAYGVFLWIYHLAGSGAIPWAAYPLSLIASLVIALAADINQVSMHRFYRNRLMEAYMPYKLSSVEQVTDGAGAAVSPKDADLCKMADIPQTRAPYQIVNTTMQTVGSSLSKLRERGGDNFIFTPLFSGADSTGYVSAKEYMKGKTNLATAMAISGAAVDPNTYATRSRPLSFFMTLLNIRLGYWIRNPRHNDTSGELFGRNPTWYSIFVEMFGKGLHEKRASIHLSDGGHFENLGIYELVKRRCRCIIVSDASADPDYQFGDLGKAIEMVRVDFGAKVRIDTTPIVPGDRTNKISPSAWAIGTILYENGETADLIYIATTLIDDLPEDVYTYQRKNPSFPDQGTGDQFFNERQFEAYRELGFQVADRLFQSSAAVQLVTRNRP